jgi:hypothetical protein
LAATPRARSPGRRRLVDLAGRQDGHRAGLLGGDVHLDHAVLQHLERRDGTPNCLRVFM